MNEITRSFIDHEPARLPARLASHSKLALAVLALVASSGAMAQDEITLLRQQMQQIQARLDKLESERAASATAPTAAPTPASPVGTGPEPQNKSNSTLPLTSGVVTGGDSPGSFKLPGSNTSVSLGGYVKGIVVYSDRSPGSASPLDEALLPSFIPLKDAASPPVETNKVKITGKESRFNIKTSTPTDMGAVTTWIEGDFEGTGGSETSTNGYAFRLRHAWGTVGNLGMGQTWSNLLNLSAVPELVDFGPVIGMLGTPRQAGLRWTNPTANGFWSVALENPETTIAGASTQPDNDKLPDLNAKVNLKTDFGIFELAGLASKLRANQAGVDNSRTGWGVGISGAIPVLKSDQFMFQLNRASGEGRYFGAGVANDAVVLNNSLQSIKETAGYVAYKHAWTPSLRSTVTYEWMKMDLPAGSAATLDEKYWSTHANLMWAVTKNALLGVEYLHASRTILNGDSGDLNRAIMTGIFAF